MKENEREEKSLAPDEDAAAKQKRCQQENRSRFFQLLAGGYLVYLAYQLISGALAQTGWPTDKIVCLIAGTAFGVIGIAQLLFTLREEARRTRRTNEPNENGKGEGEQ